MYPPSHHQESNFGIIKDLIHSFPLATVISIENNTPHITHIPLILENDILVGHLDKNNPHCDFLKDKIEVTVIFQGPQTYISPSVYNSKQLPTWNYIIAHLKGEVTQIHIPEDIMKSMVRMTATLEAPSHRFELAHEDKRMHRIVQYVHGFQIQIKSWEGKFKLSQDKSATDIENAKQELLKNSSENSHSFINNLYKKHFNQ